MAEMDRPGRAQIFDMLPDGTITPSEAGFLSKNYELDDDGNIMPLVEEGD